MRGATMDRRVDEDAIVASHLSRSVDGRRLVEDISIQVSAGDVLAVVGPTRQSVADYVQASFEASLIPAIDSLRSLGIVWIPGLMAGMLLIRTRAFTDASSC